MEESTQLYIQKVADHAAGFGWVITESLLLAVMWHRELTVGTPFANDYIVIIFQTGLVVYFVTLVILQRKEAQESDHFLGRSISRRWSGLRAGKYAWAITFGLLLAASVHEIITESSFWNIHLAVLIAGAIATVSAAIVFRYTALRE